MKKISDVIPFVPVPSPEKPVPALSKRQRQIIDLSGAIAEQTREEANELGFMSRLLLMANLPYRDPGLECRNWYRQNGNVAINVLPGYKGKEIIGLPYGAYPRLILAYLVTQAVKTQSPVIHLGKSFSQFLQLLDIKKGGKTYKQLNKQLERTLSASFSWTYEKDKRFSRINIQVSHQAQLWWDEKPAKDSLSLWDNYIKLNTDFFQEIVRNAVPLDLRVLSVLKNSPLALDLYMFILWRIYKLKKPAYISWESLQQQLGGQYADVNEFSRKCRTHIKRIKAIHPSLNISFVKGRLCLRLSF
jgi:hypothetical protein